MTPRLLKISAFSEANAKAETTYVDGPGSVAAALEGFLERLGFPEAADESLKVFVELAPEGKDDNMVDPLALDDLVRGRQIKAGVLSVADQKAEDRIQERIAV